jgi:hypothetical protein
MCPVRPDRPRTLLPGVPVPLLPAWSSLDGGWGRMGVRSSQSYSGLCCPIVGSVTSQPATCSFCVGVRSLLRVLCGVLFASAVRSAVPLVQEREHNLVHDVCLIVGRSMRPSLSLDCPATASAMKIALSRRVGSLSRLGSLCDGPCAVQIARELSALMLHHVKRAIA